MRFFVHLLIKKEALLTRRLWFQGEEFLWITARGFWQRFFGWHLWQLHAHPNTLVCIPRCQAVHQWTGRTELAVFFITDRGGIIRSRRLPFGAVRACPGAAAVIEGLAAQGPRLKELLQHLQPDFYRKFLNS